MSVTVAGIYLFTGTWVFSAEGIFSAEQGKTKIAENNNNSKNPQVYVECQMISVPESEIIAIATKLKKPVAMVDVSFLPLIYASGKYKTLACGGGITTNGSPIDLKMLKEEFFPEGISRSDNIKKQKLKDKGKKSASSGKIPFFGDPRELGMHMKLTPYIDKASIMMEVEPIFTNFIGFTKYNNLEIPEIEVFGSPSKVLLHDGETVLLKGSLKSSRDNGEKSRNWTLTVLYVKTREISIPSKYSDKAPQVNVTGTYLGVSHEEFIKVTGSNGQPSLPDKDVFKKLLDSGKAKILASSQCVAMNGYTNIVRNAKEITFPNGWYVDVDEYLPVIGDFTDTGSIFEFIPNISPESETVTLHVDHSLVRQTGWRNYAVTSKVSQEAAKKLSTIKMPIIERIKVSLQFTLTNGDPVLAAKMECHGLDDTSMMILYFISVRISSELHKR